MIARLLGPSFYGAYTLALVLPSILLYLLGLGVSVGLTRFSAQHLAKGERSVAARLTNNGVVFLLAFAGLLTIVSFVISSYVSSVVLGRPSLTPLVQVASLAVFSQGIIQSATSALLGWNAMRAISLVNIVQASLKLLIATSLVILGYGVVGALSGLIASYFLAGALAIVALYTVTKVKEDGGGFGMFLKDNSALLRYGFPHYVGTLVSGLASQYVTVVLALVAANIVVGFYQSALNVLSAVSLTSSAITLTLLPAFAHLEGIRADTALAFNYAVKYTAFLIGPIILFLIGASAPMMEILYGSSFSSADPYLVLLCLSNLPILLGYPIFPSFFSGVGKTKLSMCFFLVQAASQVVLAPSLGVYLGLGVDGLIYSILLSNLAATLLGLFFSKRVFGAFIDTKALTSIVLASLVAFAAILPFRSLSPSWLALVVDAAVFVAVYLTSAPLLGAIRQSDVVRLGIATEGMGIYSRAFMVLLRYEDRILKLRFPAQNPPQAAG